MNQETVTLDITIRKTAPMPETAIARFWRKIRGKGPRITEEGVTVRVSGRLQVHPDKQWYENGYTLWMTQAEAQPLHAVGFFPSQALLPVERSLCLDLRRIDFETVPDEARSSESQVG